MTGAPAGTSANQNPTFTFSNPGYYTVSLTANGITETKTNYIRVYANPTASYTVSSDTVCSGTVITITNTSTPGDTVITQGGYTWNDGSPVEATLNTTTHTYTTTTQPYQVFVPNFLIVDGHGCNSTYSENIWVFPAPVANIGTPQILSCAVPINVNFNQSSTGSNIYAWDFGDPSSGSQNTSTVANPAHAYADTGSYMVYLTVVYRDVMTLIHYHWC